MTTPAADDIHKAKAVMGNLRDYNGGQYRDLLERLGEFFPHAGQFAWLDDNDQTLGQCFTSKDGGWLEPGEDAEFWQLVAGADISGEGSEPPPSLISFLQGLLSRWEAAASAPARFDPAGPGADQGEPRFQQVGPVEGYPGWWQGYDATDGVWKYVHTGDEQPTDQTPGWAIGEVAFAPAPADAQEAAPRFQQVGPVDGYPGWWQGYDATDGAWKYVHGGSGQPTDQTPGWATYEVAFAPAPAGGQEAVPEAADGEHSEPDINDLPAPLQDVVTRLREMNDAYRDIPVSAILDALNDAAASVAAE